MLIFGVFARVSPSRHKGALGGGGGLEGQQFKSIGKISDWHHLWFMQTCAPHEKAFSILRINFRILQSFSVVSFLVAPPIAEIGKKKKKKKKSGAAYRRER